MVIVKNYSTGSLSKAKKLVEELISGKTIELTFDSEERQNEFKILASSLGAKVEE